MGPSETLEEFSRPVCGLSQTRKAWFDALDLDHPVKSGGNGKAPTPQVERVAREAIIASQFGRRSLWRTVGAPDVSFVDIHIHLLPNVERVRGD